MTDTDPRRQADEFYVPTPEELEQGLEGPTRRVRGDRARRDKRRGESRSSWARRLFRLRPGVGQKRSEAPAPTPIPPQVDSPPAVPRTEPDPPIHTESDPPVHTEPASRSRSPSSRPSMPQGARTNPPAPTPRGSVKTGSPSSSAPSGRRVRRIAVPKPKTRTPLKRPVPSPVPGDVIAKAGKLGHRLGQFREARISSSEHQRTFAAECESCGSIAYARNIADDNYALNWDTSTWRAQGPGFENQCSGDAKR